MSVSKYIEMWETIDKYSLTFICEISPSFLCIICKKVLRDAKKLQCGCKICSHCLETSVDIEDFCCPGDSLGCTNQIFSSDMKYQDDIDVNEAISNLTIKCIFDGCDFIDSAKNLILHINVCIFAKEICVQCGLYLLRRDMQEHLINECDETSVQCIHCDSSMTRKFRKTIHLNVENDDICDMYRCMCPYQCGVDIPVEIKNHLRVCENAPACCPFRDVGCGSDIILQIDMQKYLCHKGYFHSNLLIQTISNLENEIHRLDETVNSVNSRISALHVEVEHFVLENEELRSNVINRDLDQNTSTTDEERQSLFARLANISARIDFFDNMYENKYFEYIWILQDFENLLQMSKKDSNYSVTSEPFLTASNGYKLQLILFPNGIGTSRKRCMSLFFQLIKEKYDQLLPWPFKQNVEMSLLEQGGNNHHILNIFYDPTDNEMMTNYQRPLSNNVRMYGSKEFMPLNVFKNVPNLKKNNTIFIKFCAKSVNLIH